MINLRQLGGAAAVAILCAGCQSTAIRSAWFDTNFAGPPMRKVVVVVEAGSTADSRSAEDAFVARLRTEGVEGVAGHSLRLDEPEVTDERFTRGVVDSGAQGLLLVRVLGVDTRTQVTTTMVPGGVGWGRGAWGGPTGHPRAVTQISRYEIATVESKLYDVKTRQVVWAATTNTFNPRSVLQELPAFTELVVGQLRGREIIPAK